MMTAANDIAWLHELAGVLAGNGLLASRDDLHCSPLTGGVSSDIWLLEAGGQKLVVKRALAKLRVAQDWRAPVTRNVAEARWLSTVHAFLPDAVPEVLYEDAERGLFVMSFIPPSTAPVWKSQLLGGHVDARFAGAVGAMLGRIHTQTAAQPELAARFDNATDFHQLRLSPYFETTAARHPDLAARILEISQRTNDTRQCLVHGDVSPKNILAAPRGPILLDAECANWGDPAFDLAFCLNHLLLKGVVLADHRPLGAAFGSLVEHYFATVTFPPRGELEARAAAMLPALFLARVDGKSPVEYITSDEDRALVRAVASELIQSPTSRLDRIWDRWAEALAATRQ